MPPHLVVQVLVGEREVLLLFDTQEHVHLQLSEVILKHVVEAPLQACTGRRRVEAGR